MRGVRYSKGGRGPTLPPLFRGVYFSYCCGGTLLCLLWRGTNSARLFRWRTLSTGVRGATYYSVYGVRGASSLPHYFNGLLSLLGRGGYSVHGGEGAYSAYWGGEDTLSREGEGAYLCPPISWPTMPTGVGGGGGVRRYSVYVGEGGLLCPPISGE